MAPQARARLLWFLSTFVHHVARTTLAIVACVAFASSAFAQTIAAGSLHTVVATPDGNVWTWGSNASSQLGLGAGASSKKVPTQIPTLSNIIAVAAGNDFSLALDSSGVVWAWGSNGFGQLGNGNNTTQNTPVALSLTNIVAIAASYGHSVALDSSGVVYTWGYNFYGQLGNSSTANSNTPVQLSTPTSVSAIAAGVYHTLVVKTDGSVYGWGWNVSGQLGTGSTTPNNQTSPVQMSGISSGAAAVAGGLYHSLVLMSDGTVKATGLNGSGQLGVSGGNVTSPVTVTALTGVTAIRAGESHSIIRKSDATVRAFGSGGQLGTGPSGGSTPVTPTGLPSTISLIAAGQSHSFAVTDDGVVWAWGTNGNGQLGEGTPYDRSTPLTISDLAYDWRVGRPYFSPNGTTQNQNVTVFFTEETPGATIHYTVNGDEPTESDPTVASGGSILIDRVRTLKVKAWKSGMPESHVGSAVFTLAVAQPTLTTAP